MAKHKIKEKKAMIFKLKKNLLHLFVLLLTKYIYATTILYKLKPFVRPFEKFVRHTIDMVCEPKMNLKDLERIFKNNFKKGEMNSLLEIAVKLEDITTLHCKKMLLR